MRAGLARVVIVAVLALVGVVVVARPAAASVSASSLDAGSSHTCAVVGATVSCWGYNIHGRLGDGTTTDRHSPVPVDTSGVLNGVTLTQVSTGGFHTCALSSEGKAYCWGSNTYGQLGDGTITDRHSPVAVDTSGALNGVTLTHISTGNHHTCALSSDGKAYCWGSNSSGRLGDGTTTNRHTPVAVDTSGALNGVTLTHISTGFQHTCAVASTGKAYCWGFNSDGQVGDGTTTNRHSPVAVDTSGALNGATLTQASAGGFHTCALSSTGIAYCWGYNTYGQVGDGTTTHQHSPVAVDTSGALNGATLHQIDGGYFHTCALSSDGKAYCWGNNTNGRLGDGTTTNRTSPVPVDTSGALNGVTLTQASAGYYHTCALASTGDVYCWGYNNYGQLGDGTTTGHTTPVAVNNFPNVPPAAPTGVTATVGEQQATITWAASAWLGSGTLTGYTVTASPGGATCTTTTTSCTITGLTGGTTYTFTVVTHTTAGTSPTSTASNPVTPTAPQPTTTPSTGPSPTPSTEPSPTPSVTPSHTPNTTPSTGPTPEADQSPTAMPRTGTALTTALTVGLALIATGAALLTLLRRRPRVME